MVELNIDGDYTQYKLLNLIDMPAALVLTSNA